MVIHRDTDVSEMDIYIYIYIKAIEMDPKRDFLTKFIYGS